MHARHVDLGGWRCHERQLKTKDNYVSTYELEISSDFTLILVSPSRDTSIQTILSSNTCRTSESELKAVRKSWKCFKSIHKCLTSVCKSAPNSVTKGGANPRDERSSAPTIKISPSFCVLPTRRGTLRNFPAEALAVVSLKIVMSKRVWNKATIYKEKMWLAILNKTKISIGVYDCIFQGSSRDRLHTLKLCIIGSCSKSAWIWSFWPSGESLYTLVPQPTALETLFHATGSISRRPLASRPPPEMLCNPKIKNIPLDQSMFLKFTCRNAR